jgi:hypothetical protein
MNPIRIVPWWASLGVGAEPPADDPDPADLGTAFGLEASMAEAARPPQQRGRTVAGAPSPDRSDPEDRRD